MRSQLFNLCVKDVKKVLDNVEKKSNELIKQLDQIISYSNTENIQEIQQSLYKVLKEVGHEIISQDYYNLKDYFKYIYKQIKNKFEKNYQLKNKENARTTLLVSVQMCSHKENSEIIQSVKEYLLKEMNNDKSLSKDIFFQEIFILSRTLLKLEMNCNSGVWSLSEN